jgi:site-specific recombinase XerC
MRPPRVYLRGSGQRGVKYFWVEFWNPQRQEKVRKPIQGPDMITLEADIEPPEVYTPEWWRKSRHRKLIQEFLLDVQLHRIKLARWEAPEPKRVRDLTLDELHRAYNDDRALKGGDVEQVTHANRDNAIKFLKQYGVKSVRQVTTTKVLEIRRDAKDDYAPGSVKEYFKRLRPMFALAVKHRVISENPFEGVKVEVKRTGGKAIPLEAQLKQFQALYEADRMLCAQTLYLRLGAYRAKDSCTLKVEQIDFEAGVLNVWNNKGKRREVNPMSRAMKAVLRWAVGDRDSGFVFPTRNPAVLYSRVNRITKSDLHTYKDCFADEIAPHVESDDLKRYLMHHQSESIEMLHYQKPPVEQARKVLNEAQRELETWVRNGYTA